MNNMEAQIDVDKAINVVEWKVRFQRIYFTVLQIVHSGMRFRMGAVASLVALAFQNCGTLESLDTNSLPA